jgi:hypothetical protein
MEQSPAWEAHDSSDTQGIPRILSYPQVYYHVHKITLLCGGLSLVKFFVYMTFYNTRTCISYVIQKIKVLFQT